MNTEYSSPTDILTVCSRGIPVQLKSNNLYVNKFGSQWNYNNCSYGKDGYVIIEDYHEPEYGTKFSCKLMR